MNGSPSSGPVPFDAFQITFYISTAAIYFLMQIIHLLSDGMDGFFWIREAYTEFSGWTSGIYIVYFMYNLLSAQYVQIPKIRLSKMQVPVVLVHLNPPLTILLLFPALLLWKGIYQTFNLDTINSIELKDKTHIISVPFSSSSRFDYRSLCEYLKSSVTLLCSI